MKQYLDRIKSFIKEDWRLFKYIPAAAFLWITYVTMNDIQLEFIPSDFYFFDKFIFIGTLIYLFFSEFKFLLNEHKKRVEYKILIVSWESLQSIIAGLFMAAIFWIIGASIIILFLLIFK